MARPREFNPEAAIEDIKDVFWRLSYEGASMQAIEEATGLNKQSLYRVFGDKRAMYLAALTSYEQREVAAAGALLSMQGDARERFKRLFADVLAQRDERGCFICNASVDQAPHDERSAAAVRRMVEGVASAFAGALAASPPYTDDRARRDAKATSLMASYFGLRTMIRAGMPMRQLKAAAADAIAGI